MARAALFDFDGTLTWADTFVPFLRYAAGRGAYYRGVAKLTPDLIAYSQGRIDRQTAKNMYLSAFLKGLTVEEIDEIGRRYASERLPRLVNPTAMEALEKHRTQGDLVMIVSASLECYIKPWADQFGLKAEATRLAVGNGVLTGEMEGLNCRGAEKVVRARPHLENHAIDHVSAYGDTDGDREMLAMANEAHYKPFRGIGFGLRSRLAFLRSMI